MTGGVPLAEQFEFLTPEWVEAAHKIREEFEGKENFGWYERTSNPIGSQLPQQITEFTNSGIVCGLASVNMSPTPEDSFLGYWGACSTYGSFSYLKYGLMRLFSQLALDCEL